MTHHRACRLSVRVSVVQDPARTRVSCGTTTRADTRINVARTFNPVSRPSGLDPRSHMDPICYESTRTATTRKATWVLTCAPRVPPCICDMPRYPPRGPPLVYTLLVLSTRDGTKDVSLGPLVGGWTGRINFPVVVTSPSFLSPFLSGPTVRI